jgi:hypothetical protein
MKLLIALSLLCMSSAFAEFKNTEIKCYESARGSRGRISYILESKDGMIYLTYPILLQAELKLNYEGCLERPNGGSVPKGTISSISSPRNSLELCPNRGQEIQKLVLFEARLGLDVEAVYCEREIQEWLKSDPQK